MYFNRNMFSYQRLTWRLDKNISGRLSCLKPLSHFLIYKAPPISRLKQRVVTLIGRNDKVAEVKPHQTSILFNSYLKEKRHDNNPIFVITIIIFFLKTTLPLYLTDLQTEEPTLQCFL